MRTRPSTRKPLAGLLLVATAAVAWFLFAPTAFGGSTDWVTTDGVSMLPRFHSGDLVLTHREPSYHVGEIVAYQNHMLHTVVLHRIVRIEGDHYLFKGDNNSFVDPEHPTRDQLIGKLWLHLPGWGKRLAWLRAPKTIGLIVAAGTFLLAGGLATGRRRRRRRRAEEEGGARVSAPGPLIGYREGMLTVGFLVLLIFTALAALAFTHPRTSATIATASYTQSGTFSYSGRAGRSAAYPDGRVATGDPVFTGLVSSLRVGFRYHFAAPGSHRVSGTAGLDAVLESSTGWKRTIHLTAPQPFSGDHARVTGTLDVRALQPLIARLEATTSVSGTYELGLVPRLAVKGLVDRGALNVHYAPTLSFSLTPQELMPLLAAQSSSDATTTTDKLAPTSPGSITYSRPVPARLSFKVAGMRVSTARAVAVPAMAASLLSLLTAILFVGRGRPETDESTEIRARYHDWLVPVTRVRRPPGRQTVEVDDMEALVRIAERYERMILHEAGPAFETFTVADDGVLYQYTVATEAGLDADVLALERTA